MADAIKEAVKDIKFYLDRIEALDKRNKELEAALTGAEAWIDRWTKHVGSCAGGSVCGCGRTLVLYEARAALGEKKDG